MPKAWLRWTKGERLLVVAPLLLSLGLVYRLTGQTLGYKLLGVPYEFWISPNYQIKNFASSRNGRILAVEGDDYLGGWFRNRGQSPENHRIFLWNTQTLQPLPSIATPDAGNFPYFRRGLALTPDGEKFAYSESGNYRLIDLKSRATLWSRNLSGESADFSPDGQRLIVFVKDQLHLLDAKSGKTLRHFKAPITKTYLRWTPDGRFWGWINAQLQANFNRMGPTVELYDREGRFVRQIGSQYTSSFDFSPDNRWVVFVEGIDANLEHQMTPGDLQPRASIRCEDFKTGKLLWKFQQARDKPYVDPYQEAIFSPDMKIVAVQDVGSHQILLLNAGNGKVMRRLGTRFKKDRYVSSGFPHSLSFSGDGKRLFARGYGSVFHWEIG